MPSSNLALGLASAIGVIFIWSGFMVFSRAGVTGGLTAYDLAALRFIIAGGLVVPFIYDWWPKRLPLGAQAVMALSGPGAIYTLLMYSGLSAAPAAYAGVFANGSLPIFTTRIVFLLSGDRPGWRQCVAIAAIVFGGVLVGYPGLTTGGSNLLLGIAIFLLASAILSIYIVGIKYWQVTPYEALALINIPNALVFLPIWMLFLPSTLADANSFTVAFQALFQGLGPGFLAVILFAIATISLGTTATAGFSASVPASAALLAMPVLSEFPTPIEWAGIVIVTFGLALLLIRQQNS